MKKEEKKRRALRRKDGIAPLPRRWNKEESAWAKAEKAKIDAIEELKAAEISNMIPEEEDERRLSPDFPGMAMQRGEDGYPAPVFGEEEAGEDAQAEIQEPAQEEEQAETQEEAAAANVQEAEAEESETDAQSADRTTESAALQTQGQDPAETPDASPQKAKRQKKERKRAQKELATLDANPPPKKRRRYFRNTALTLASLFVIALVGAFFYFDVPNWQQLDISKITAAPQTGSLYDNQRNLVTTIRGAQNRVAISLSDLSEQTRNVFLAAEDLRFYSHYGMDVVRMFGAVKANLKEGSFSQGGSTITMQLIRQSHLSTQKTVARKLEEIYLAVMLEQQMTKDQIFEMYLNYIYYGNGAYGIQAAAQTYFGVDAADLSLIQAATLAGILKAPSYYAPHISEENNRARRAYILATMLEEGMIDQATHDRAAKEEVVLASIPKEELQYGWFVDAVLDEAEQILGFTGDQVLTGGYHIDTTLSREHQNLLEKQFTANVFPANASDGTQVQGAAACVDNKTGAVLAIVGGREYTVRRGLNRATQLRRQPGSALKPLVAYAPAIDQYGYMTCSVLKDEPTNFGGYKPRNSGYAYYGNVSIRTALANSLNVAAVSLLNQIGVQAGKNYLDKVGIPLDKNDDNLALALGAMTYGVSPVQLAAAYAPFGNGGVYNSAHFITKITDSQGRVLYQRRESSTQVLKAQSAYLMTSLLSSVTSSGTGAKLSAAGTPVAGKTGTNSITGGGNRDIWMACYNSEVSCAFWMGFDQTDSSHKLPGWVSGGDNTALMAKNYFQQLYQGKSKPQFSKPGGIVSLEIDKQAIKWRGEAMLASELTPAAYRYTEVFISGNQPTKRSDVWTPPRSLNRFTVGHNENGYPLLMLQPADSAVYRVQRDAIGESFILTELYGTAGETLYFTDTKAQAGVVYTYRVIPVHAELLNNGIVLEGMQSVQVAQAKLAGRGSVLDGIVGFLFGAGSQQPDAAETSVDTTTENNASIFWTD